MYCSSCGRLIDNGVSYCNFCGASVAKSAKPSFKIELPSLSHKRTLQGPQQQELVMQFRHIRDQIDLTNTEAEIRGLLNQSENLRVQSQSVNRELANSEHMTVAKKAKARASYLGFKDTAKYAGKVISRLLLIS